MKKKILTYCRGRCIYTASRARHICMLRDNWPVIDWREPIGLQERLEGRSFHNGVISVMSRDSLKGNSRMSKLRQRQRNIRVKTEHVTDCVFLPAHTTSNERGYTQFVHGLIGSEACRVASRGG